MSPRPHFLDRPRAWDAPRISQSPSEYADPVECVKRDSKFVDRLWWIAGLSLAGWLGYYVLELWRL